MSEQHVILGLRANMTQLKKSCAQLRKRIEIVKCGDIKMPEFTPDMALTDNKIDTLELAYLCGWEAAMLACGEVLSKDTN